MADTALSRYAVCSRVTLDGNAQAVVLDSDCDAVDIKVTGNAILWSADTAPTDSNSYRMLDGDADHICTDALNGATFYVKGDSAAGYVWVRKWRKSA